MRLEGLLPPPLSPILLSKKPRRLPLRISISPSPPASARHCTRRRCRRRHVSCQKHLVRRHRQYAQELLCHHSTVRYDDDTFHSCPVRFYSMASASPPSPLLAVRQATPALSFRYVLPHLISNKTTPPVWCRPEWATAIFHWARTTAASFGKLYRGDFSASLHHLAVLTASRWAPGLSLAVRA